MEKEAIFELVCRSIEETTEISTESVDLKTDIMYDLGLSSLEIMAICASVEASCKIQIKSEDIQKIATVGDFVELIFRSVSEQ